MFFKISEGAIARLRASVEAAKVCGEVKQISSDRLIYIYLRVLSCVCVFPIQRHAFPIVFC